MYARESDYTRIGEGLRGVFSAWRVVEGGTQRVATASCALAFRAYTRPGSRDSAALVLLAVVATSRATHGILLSSSPCDVQGCIDRVRARQAADNMRTLRMVRDLARPCST